jgi:hypothetical protein
MPQWARLLVLLLGMITWVAIVAVSLWLRQIPGAVLIGFPAGLWVALSSGTTIARKRAAKAARAAAEIASSTDKESDSA